MAAKYSCQSLVLPLSLTIVLLSSSCGCSAQTTSKEVGSPAEEARPQTTDFSWEQVQEQAGLRAGKQPEMAEDLYREALEKARAAKAPPVKILKLLYARADLLSNMDECVRADKLLTEGVTLAEASKIKDWQASFLVRQALNDRPLVTRGLKKSLEIEPVQKALDLRPGDPDVPTEFRGLAYIAMGRAYQYKKDYSQAEKYYSMAKEQFAGAGGLTWRLMHANENMLNLFVSSGQYQKANQLFLKLASEDSKLRYHYVDIYRGCIPTGTADNTGWSGRLDKLVKARDFDGLEAFALECRSHAEPFALGDYQIDKVMSYFEAGRIENRCAERVDLIKGWVEAKPKSVTAKIALANAYTAWAWAARGGGWANTVTDKGWQLFHDRLEQSAQILALIPEGERPGDYYPVYEKTCMGLDSDDSSQITAAKAKFPHYKKIAVAKYWSLQPRWGGEEGADMRYLNDLVASCDAHEGSMLYARVAVEETSLFSNVFVDGKFEKDRVLAGMKLIRANYPQSIVARVCSIQLALDAGDMPLAQSLADAPL